MKQLLVFIVSCLAINSYAQLTYKNVTVQYDSAWTFQNLQLIPLRYTNDKYTEKTIPHNYLSLKDGMHKGKVQIKEFFFNGDADVHILVVKNNSKQTLLINSGEMLKGGKQDRVIGETKLIPPGGEGQYLNTYCIEQGRWDKKPKSFNYAGTADADIRQAVEVTKEQRSVWKAIENKFKDSNKSYDLKSYLEIYKPTKADSVYTSYFINQFAHSDSTYAGFIAVSGDKIIGADVFVDKELTNASFGNILSSYVSAVNKKQEKPEVSYSIIKQFADDLLSDEEKQQKFLSKKGKAFYYEKQLIQVSAYGK